MITNKFNLPAPLVNAIKNDPYTKGHSDISTTTLIGPPQMRKLMQGREVTEDASECIWRLFGQGIHKVLEQAYPDTAIVEQRLYAEVRGWIVSGQFDVFDNGVLSDYKTASVYAYGKAKPEWENQLNVLAQLARRNNMPVTKLEIVAIWRDWRPREAQFDESYPQAQVSVIPIQLWTEAEAEAYLDGRVRLHQLDIPPPCTDTERWKQESKWAMMKKGAKRAVKLYPDPLPEEWLGKDLMPGLYWEHRPGAYTRCDRYCAAADICPQNLAHKREAA